MFLHGRLFCYIIDSINVLQYVECYRFLSCSRLVVIVKHFAHLFYHSLFLFFGRIPASQCFCFSYFLHFEKSLYYSIICKNTLFISIPQNLFRNLFTLLLFYFLVTLDKLRCISTIKMNEFILYCLRFAVTLHPNSGFIFYGKLPKCLQSISYSLKIRRCDMAGEDTEQLQIRVKSTPF